MREASNLFGTLYLDLKSNFIVWNNINNSIFNFPDKLIPEFNDIINPYFNKYFSERKDTLQVFEYILILIKDKSEKELSFTVPIKGLDGSVGTLKVDYFRDSDFVSIFFFKSSKNLESEQSENLEKLVEMSDSGGLEFSVAHNRITFSHAAKRILRIGSDQKMMSFNSFALDLLQVDPKETWDGIIRNFRYSNQFSTEFDVCFNGSAHKKVRIQGKMLLEDYSCRKVLAVIQDISKSKDLDSDEKLILDFQAKAFCKICEQLNFLILSIDGNLKISFMNQGVKTLFRHRVYQKDELNVRDLFSKDNVACLEKELINPFLLDGNHSNFFMSQVNSNDEIVYIDWKLIPFSSSNKRYGSYLLVGIDLARYYPNKGILDELVNELSSQKRRFREFSHLISHEIRPHVANIQGLLSIMVYLEDGKEKEDYLEFFKSAVDSLDDSLGKTSSILTVQNHELTRWRQFSLSKLLDEVFFNFMPQFLSYDFNFKILDHEEISVFSNRNFLRNVLNEIISVFIIFRSSNEKPKLEIETKIESKKYLSISLSDNGSSYEALKEIKVSLTIGSTNSQKRGFGNLRIFLIKHQIESLNGYFQLERVNVMSSSFKIFLPYEKI